MAHDDQKGRLLQLIDAVTKDAVFLLAQDGQIAGWNTSAEQVLGYPRAEIIGRSLAICCPKTPEKTRTRGDAAPGARDGAG